MFGERLFDTIPSKASYLCIASRFPVDISAIVSCRMFTAAFPDGIYAICWISLNECAKNLEIFVCTWM